MHSPELSGKRDTLALTVFSLMLPKEMWSPSYYAHLLTVPDEVKIECLVDHGCNILAAGGGDSVMLQTEHCTSDRKVWQRAECLVVKTVRCPFAGQPLLHSHSIPNHPWTSLHTGPCTSQASALCIDVDLEFETMACLFLPTAHQYL